MAVKTEINVTRNLIVHHFSEIVSLQIILRTIQTTLNDPQYLPGMNAIWYCEDGTNIKVNSDEAQIIAEHARKAFDSGDSPYKLALVSNDDLAYGMNRVYEGWSNDRPIEINTFRKLDDAYNWIEN